MPSGAEIIVTLKVLVAAVTVLFAASIWAIAKGHKRLHGRINRVFFFLTMATVIGFESLLRFGIDVTSTFSESARQALQIHLKFAVPSAVLLPVMLLTGIKHWRRLHVPLAIVFTLLWIGTFITGVFFLPHGE